MRMRLPSTKTAKKSRSKSASTRAHERAEGDNGRSDVSHSPKSRFLSRYCFRSAPLRSAGLSARTMDCYRIRCLPFPEPGSYHSRHSPFFIRTPPVCTVALAVLGSSLLALSLLRAGAISFGTVLAACYRHHELNSVAHCAEHP